MLVSYPGIIRIGYMLADNLPANTTYHALAGIPISLFLRPTTIPLSGGAELSVEASNDHNGTAESLTLTFRSPQQLSSQRALALVVTDANHRTWLIGQLEKPHLSVTATRSTGATDGEAAVITYEVKHTAPICLKPCKLFV